MSHITDTTRITCFTVMASTSMLYTVQVKGVCGGLSGKEDCCHCMKLRNVTTTTKITFEPITTMEPTSNSVDGGEEEESSTMTTEAFSTAKTTPTAKAVSDATTKAQTESPELNTCEDSGCAQHFAGQGR